MKKVKILTMSMVGLVTYLVLWGASTFSSGSISSELNDWPQFLGPNRNGIYLGSEIATSWPEMGPGVIWRKKIGQGFSGPVVKGNRLILFHRVGNQEKIECLNSKTGNVLWSYSYFSDYKDDFGFDEGPRSTPTIEKGKIYLLGAKGILHCLDLKSGMKIWSVDTQKKFGFQKGFFGVACSPLVKDGRLFLNIGGIGGSGLVAFSAETGRVLWTATNEKASYSSPVARRIGNLRQILFLTRTGLVGTDPENGQVLFRFPWSARSRASVNAATPLTTGKLIFLSASYQTGAILLKVKGTSLEKKWMSGEVLSNHYSTSILTNNLLFGFHGRQEYGAALRCIELETGKVLWSQDRFGSGTLSLSGKQLIVLKENGELLLVRASPEAFHIAAKSQILSPTVRAYPAIANGYLYARNQKELICVSLKKFQ